MDVNVLFSLLGKCIISDENGNIIYPTDQECLNSIRSILKYKNEHGIYEYDSRYYDYTKKTIDSGDHTYYAEIFNDITDAINLLQNKYSSLILKYRKDLTTGLDNKELAFEKFDSYLEEVISRNTSFACITIDADFFKNINDTYGHQIGDSVLEEIANILLRHTRKNDIVGRIGGEEFIIVLKNISFEAAYAKAEEIRKDAERDTIDENGTTINVPTLSLGLNYVECREINRDENIEELRKEIIDKSDIACYFSKNKGRNIVSVYQNNSLKRSGL